MVEFFGEKVPGVQGTFRLDGLTHSGGVQILPGRSRLVLLVQTLLGNSILLLLLLLLFGH